METFRLMWHQLKRIWIQEMNQPQIIKRKDSWIQQSILLIHLRNKITQMINIIIFHHSPSSKIISIYNKLTMIRSLIKSRESSPKYICRVWLYLRAKHSCTRLKILQQQKLCLFPLKILKLDHLGNKLHQANFRLAIYAWRMVTQLKFNHYTPRVLHLKLVM